MVIIEMRMYIGMKVTNNLDYKLYGYVCMEHALKSHYL